VPWDAADLFHRLAIPFLTEKGNVAEPTAATG